MPKLDLSFTTEELDAYLTAQKTIRLATVSPSGTAHVVPLWFVWVGGLVFMNSTRGNVTIRNLEANPAATGVVDDGETYDQLRGVIVKGRVGWGHNRRTDDVHTMWSQKYLAGNPVPFDRWKNRVWFHLFVDHLSSWDFRKIPEARARAERE